MWYPGESSDQWSLLVNLSDERYHARVKCLFKKEQENGHVIGTAKCVILKENSNTPDSLSYKICLSKSKVGW